MNDIVIKECSLNEVIYLYSKIQEFCLVFNSDVFTQRVGDKKYLIIAAYLNKAAIGFVVAYDHFNDGSFYCWLAAVDPKFRRRGVLKKLMDYLYYWSKQNGYRKIKIKTRNKFHGMLNYLIQNDYQIYDIIKKDVIEENRLLLEKILL